MVLSVTFFSCFMLSKDNGLSSDFIIGNGQFLLAKLIDFQIKTQNDITNKTVVLKI